MSDVQVHDDDDQEDRPDLRVLREKAGRSDTLQAENAELQKKLLFMEAGIDRSSPLGGLLWKSSESETAEALKAEASAVGYFGELVTPTQPPPTVEGRTETDVRNALTTGTDPDPVTPHTGIALYEQKMRSQRGGMPQENAFLGLIDSVIIDGAQNPNSPFRFNRREWMEQCALESAGDLRG